MGPNTRSTMQALLWFESKRGRLRVHDLTELIQALTGLAWPVIAGLLIWRLFPTIKDLVRSRGFTVKVGEAELTVQEVSEQVLRTTAEIQGRLASVGFAQVESRAEARVVQAGAGVLKKVLWVDDQPTNNTYEEAQLRSLGVTVRVVTSTSAALRAMNKSSEPFDAIISDMGRREGLINNPNAGIELIREVRNSGYETPVFIYASTRQAARKSEIAEVGGGGSTSSVTELFELLRTVGEFPNQAG